MARQLFNDRNQLNFIQHLKLAKIGLNNPIQLIDIGLPICALFLYFTEETVLFFHLIFVLLSIGAFYWKFRGFIIRALVWVTLTTLMVLSAVTTGHTHAEELIEIPLLTTILITVFAIAGRRAKAETKARQLNTQLEQRIIELNETNAALVAEREKSQRLLLNILPEAIAERLKEDEGTIAENFAEVSILFADLVNFTQLSTEVPPVEMVKLLNEIFSAFDSLAEKHGLEKIKTIGDAYMAVAGLPEPRSDHAIAIADMALDMQRVIEQFNQQYQQPFSIRIGINTGSVVAGVIGTKKFIYDLWGDAVNTASRMESHGIPNRIQVSSETYKRLCDRYDLENRGFIHIKGKGQMETYFLVGRKLGELVAI